ncbi:MAG: DUF4352 domain-containing protein [Rubrobacter sp.]|nr:DUF4352 domain-containing protein [Rubrobacter sp.]
MPGVPPPPQPEQPKGGRLRTVITVLVILIVLLAVVAECGSRGNTNSSDSATDSKAEEEKKETAKEKDKGKQKEEAAEVGVGQPVTAGDIEWTVTDARQTDRLSQESFGQFGDTKTGNFVVVDLLFTNNGNEPSTLSPQSLTLMDSSDRESRPDTDTIGYIPNERNIFLEQVNPGVAQEGTAIFTVAPDASGFRLQVGDTNPFGGEDALVDLGF